MHRIDSDAAFIYFVGENINIERYEKPIELE